MDPFETTFVLPDMVVRDLTDDQGNQVLDPDTGFPQLVGHTVTHGDIGRVLVHRTPLRNALDPANGLVWIRDIFRKATVAEIQTGAVEIVNLMNPAETGLPELTLGDLNCIASGILLMKLCRRLDVQLNKEKYFVFRWLD